MVSCLNVISGFAFNSSTCSDVESTKGSDSTESADEVDGISEMLDDETSFNDNVPSPSECVEATTTQIISYGPHCKLSRGDDIYSLKDEYEMVQDTKFVCKLIACFW